MFKLLRYFSLTSAVALITATIVLVIVFRQHEVEETIDNAERQNVALARSFANTVWPRFAAYLNGASGLDGNALRAQQATHQIHETLRTLTHGLPVLKIKIYALDGQTIYSSDLSELGENEASDPGFLKAAVDGVPASELIFRNTFATFEGEVYHRDLVESYIPINHESGGVDGVFELYTDVTPLVAVIRGITIEIAVGLIGAFSLLYTILYLIVRRADRIMKKQYRDLKATEEDIRKKNHALEAEVIARVVAQEALRESEEHLRSIVENAGDAIFVHRSDGRIVEANSAACHLTGYSREELLQMRVADITVDHDDGRHVEDWTRIVPGRPMTYESVHRRKDGTTFPVEVRVGAYKSGENPQIVLIARDITSRRETEERIKHMASHDVLTGLPNRYLFLDRLSAALAAARRAETMVGVLFVDLDSFKAVNDSLGHEAGDLLLVEAARRLNACVRESDTVARFGGDEFVVALTSVTDRAGTARVAENIVTAMTRPFVLNGTPATCGASVGIAIYPDNGETAEILLKHADAAMYAAKRTGLHGYRLAPVDFPEELADVAQGLGI